MIPVHCGALAKRGRPGEKPGPESRLAPCRVSRGRDHHRVERLHEIDDRLLKILALAIAEQLGLDAVTKGRSVTSKILVAGPDNAALDRFDVRLRELGPKLDAALMNLAAAFVKEHTGLRVTTIAE